MVQEAALNTDKIIPITEVVKGIFRIGPLDTFNRRTPATAPFLVVGEQQAAIVEPGEVGQAPGLLEAIREIGVDLGHVAYIIASHIHLHHIAGINFLLSELPQAKFVIHRRGAPYVIEPTRLNASTFQVWGEGCPQISPVPEDRILAVAGGEVLDLGGRDLEIIEALGHAPHHIVIFDRLTRALFPGDSVGTFGLGKERGHPDILPPIFEVEKEINTLHLLRDLNPSVLLLFGYGGISHSPDRTIQWAEEDIRALEVICREGMEQKLSYHEIGSRMGAYYISVGTLPPGSEELGARIKGGPIGMCAYLKRQDPSLEMPSDIDRDYRGFS